MKTKNYIIILIIICMVGCSNSGKESHFKQPSETVKIIETRHYYPICYNGEWINGEEINHIEYIPTIVYLDSFNNEILNINIYDEKENKSLKIRKEYYSPKDKQIDKIYYCNLGEYGVVEYIRNSNGKILEIKTPENGYIPFDVYNNEYNKFEYDSHGFKIIASGETKTKFTKRILSEKNIISLQYEIYDVNCEYSYNLKKGIIESGVEIYDSNTKVLLTKTINYYKYGELGVTKKHEYLYDENGHLIKEEMNGYAVAQYLAIPRDLPLEERENYIKDNYYGENATFSETGYIRFFEYNHYGDCTKYIYITLPDDEINIDASERNEFIYNKSGDWIKCIKFHIGEDTPDEIIMRKISYVK